MELNLTGLLFINIRRSLCIKFGYLVYVSCELRKFEKKLSEELSKLN